MSKEIVLEVSSDSVEREVGHALLGRANDLHDNPDDSAEDVAEELHSLSEEILN